MLLVLASVDLATFRLPDLLTLPMAAAGLLLAGVSGARVGGATFEGPRLGEPRFGEAAFGAHLAGLVIGYGAIAAVGWAFERLRGRRGIGLGDAKLFAAAGAWLGWAALPSVMLVACALGLAGFALAVLRRGRGALSQAVPFGPALCGGTWLVWLMQGG